MPVHIYNITQGEKIYDDTAEHDYLLAVNAEHIVTFSHRRDEGLATCLRRAADAMDAAGIPNKVTPFKRNRFMTTVTD